ncbi:hypothetical protein PENSPDRAFT_269142 [Peniophora sp. CONT]|nr:hypothetical protein PENSPDRAFT_269142 [Peniophora sp. CONT]
MPPRKDPEKPVGRKRVKTAEVASTGDGSRPRKRNGKLSVLPTLSLDVLYEIFGHLDPADLVSLARTTKSFRKVLLERHSTFLWREALDRTVEEGFPPRPEDMSEPAWAGFFFGGSNCSICSAKTNLDVCWEIRKRFCKTCAETQLVPYAMQPYLPLKNPDTDLRTVIPSDNRRASSLVKNDLYKNDRYSKIAHLYLGDAIAYEDALKELRDAFSNDEEWETRRAELDARMNIMNLARREHAQRCVSFESERAASRSAGRDEIRRARWDNIVKRLQELGYERQDIYRPDVKNLKEVREPKLLSDKIWGRIQSGIVETVLKERSLRHTHELNLRRITREAAMQQEIDEQVLRHVHHSVLSFLPPGIIIQNIFSHARALIEPDIPEVTDLLRRSIRDALPQQIPLLQRVMDERAQVLRRAIPSSWSLPEAQPQVAGAVDMPEMLNATSFADLDRAVFVTRCKTAYTRDKEKLLHFGLDILAHFCENVNPYRLNGPLDALTTFEVEVDEVGHATAEQIVELLGLDGATATPLDLDRQNRAFVCVGCPRNSLGAIFSTWRDAIAHADPHRREAHTSKRPVFRLASVSEQRYVHSRLDVLLARLPRDRIWGCGHCAEHIVSQVPQAHGFWDWRRSHGKWEELGRVRQHLLSTHNIANVVEGQDIYYQRSLASSRFMHMPYARKRTRRRNGFAEDIILPSTSDDTLNELSSANEAQSATAANNLVAWTQALQAALAAEPDEEDGGSDSDQSL